MEFVDFATKAKELGISEGTLRARALSGLAPCFMYAADLRACATVGWLPPYDRERFPMVSWEDYGSAIPVPDGAGLLQTFGLGKSRGNDTWPPPRTPRYRIRGWIGIHIEVVGNILTRGKAEPYLLNAGVLDSDLQLVCEVDVQLKPSEEWVRVDTAEYPDGGYWREIPPSLKPDDLFMSSKHEVAAQKVLSPRKEQSYLGVIAALRGLLRHKDGGGFPSDAKIIDQLVDRYKSLDGVSKRNLETVFADATRAAGDLVPPK